MFEKTSRLNSVHDMTTNVRNLAAAQLKQELLFLLLLLLPFCFI
jgi:hypothetical protein